MIVLDASAMVEALVGRAPHDDLLDVLAGELHAPHLLDVEVMSVLRGLLLSGKLPPAAAEDARRDHFAFTVRRHDLEPLAAYDAAYLALAEALGCELWTCDAKLAGGGHDAQVRLVPRSS